MPEAGRKLARRITCALVAALVLANGGCLAVAVGVAGGAAATAGYYYYKGRLYRDYPTGLGDALSAVHTALVELQLPIESEEPGTGEAFVLARTADGAKVRVYLDVVPSRIPVEGAATRVSVRVGPIGDEAVSARILDQVTRHLAPPPLAAPAGPPQPVLGPIQPTSAARPPETAPPPLAAPEPAKPR